MVYKHPISYLQDDINNIIDHGKKQIMEALKGNQRAKDKKNRRNTGQNARKNRR